MSEFTNPGFEARFTLAQAETTPPEVLAKLAIDTHAKIRRAVALNPSTPIKSLLRLGKEFPNEIIENPIFFLLLLEDPESQFVRLSLARSTTTDEAKLIQLFEENDPDIRCAIAQNPNAPLSLLVRFVQESYQRYDDGSGTTEKVNRILRGFVQNPDTVASILEELAYLSDPELTQAVLQHPNVSETAIAIIQAMRGQRGIPSAILDQLVNHQHHYVRYVILAHPDLAPEHLLKLAEDTELYWDLLDRRETLPTLVIDRIAEKTFQILMSPAPALHAAEMIVLWIARHRNTSIALLQAFASNQPDYLYQHWGEQQFQNFRAAVARNSSTPTFVLRKLSRDLKAEVRDTAKTALRSRKLSES
ncbi:leucine rich repeat variant [Leptolyngbya sp. NIES-3755]|nr:leucine rich repeat variant [Leptolyngbya sp. NIES-3755]